MRHFFFFFKFTQSIIHYQIRTYLKKIFQSGMAIEQLLSNIDYYMMTKNDLEESVIDIEAESNNFFNSKSEIISEKRILVDQICVEKISLKFSIDIFTRILENLFIFSFKAFRSSKVKEIKVIYKQIEDFLYIVYVDSSDNIFISGDYFTFNEVLEAKRGLSPKFLERYVDIYGGNIVYLNNKKLRKELDDLKLDYDIKTYSGFIIKLSVSN